MPFVQQHHAETALSDTATYRQRQLVAKKLLMEVELFALLLALNLQLAQQAFLINTYTH